MKKFLKYLLESLLIVTMLTGGFWSSATSVHAAGGENIEEACEGVVRVFSITRLTQQKDLMRNMQLSAKSSIRLRDFRTSPFFRRRRKFPGEKPFR